LVATSADGLQILFPEQREGDAFLLQLLMYQGVVGFGEAGLAGSRWPVEEFLQPAIVQIIGQRPTQPSGTG
jgi:hypothetical protein